MPMIPTASRRTEHRSTERGAALISVLLISMLLLAAGGALILTTAMSATNSADSMAESQAYYAGQAGLQATLNALRGNIAPSPLIDPSSATAAANLITFRSAVSASTSNVSGDTNAPRLSRWLPYDSAYPDRVVITAPYSPLNGLAFSTTVSDPDNSSQVSFTTQGAFDSGTAAATATKSYTSGSGSNKATVTVTFTGQAFTLINNSGTSTLGTFTVSGLTNNSYAMPVNETFKLTIVQSGPWAVTTTINCALSGSISNSSSSLIITFPTNTNNLQGPQYARTTAQFSLNTGSRTIPITVTAPEPVRLLVKVTGYGPRSAQKLMQMLVSKYAFDYSASAAITLRSADDSSTLAFNSGSSSAYDYSGYDNAGGYNLGAFAVTSAVDYNYLNTLSLPSGQIVGSPSGVNQVSVASLPAFLQTADGARAAVSLLRGNAQLIDRYYTTSAQPSAFGTTSHPLMTFVDGDTDLPPGGGAGLLVVTGTLTLRGSSDFHGLILVLGAGQLLRDGGGNGNSLGSMAVARFGSTGGFLAPTFNSNGSGTSAVQYDSEWVRRALASAGPRVLGVSEY